MKSKMFLLSTLVLLPLALASCGSSKTKIGILQFGSFEALERAKQGFVDVLSKSELADKIEIDVKNAVADSANNSSMAATLAANSDLVYGVATPSASALKNAVDSINSSAPVLFSAVTNAIGANLLKNAEAPEGNCTGVLDIGPIERELEIITSFEGVDKIVSFYTATEVNSVFQVDIAENWMREHNIEFDRKTITNASEITSAFASISSDVDAVFLPTDDTIANSIGVIKNANDARTDKLYIVGSDTGMKDGTTFSMGVDYYQCGVQAGQMALAILKDGKEIKNIPVETCDQTNIIINKTWTESLGLSIPESVLSLEGAIII